MPRMAEKFPEMQCNCTFGGSSFLKVNGRVADPPLEFEDLDITNGFCDYFGGEVT
jgi:hypothetical protein